MTISRPVTKSVTESDCGVIWVTNQAHCQISLLRNQKGQKRPCVYKRQRSSTLKKMWSAGRSKFISKVPNFKEYTTMRKPNMAEIKYNKWVFCASDWPNLLTWLWSPKVISSRSMYTKPKLYPLKPNGRNCFFDKLILIQTMAQLWLPWKDLHKSFRLSVGSVSNY